MVVYHGGEGWREGQTNRGKERMIKTHVHFFFENTEMPNMACPILHFFKSMSLHPQNQLGKSSDIVSCTIEIAIFKRFFEVWVFP